MEENGTQIKATKTEATEKIRALERSVAVKRDTLVAISQFVLDHNDELANSLSTDTMNDLIALDERIKDALQDNINIKTEEAA